MKNRLANFNLYRVYSCDQDAKISHRYNQDQRAKPGNWKIRAAQKNRSLDLAKHQRERLTLPSTEKEARQSLNKNRMRANTDNPNYTNPDVYMEELQQQKNKRIQQIYNPQLCLPHRKGHNLTAKVQTIKHGN